MDDSLTILLQEDVASVVCRAGSTFDVMVKPYGNRFVLFGAGGLGSRTAEGLREVGIEPLAFTDNNENLWHQTRSGLTVLPPVDAVQRYGDSAVFLVTTWNHEIGHPIREINEQLNECMPVRVVSFAYLYWKYPDVFLPFFGIELPQCTLNESERIMKCYSLLADESSRKEYIAQIRWRLWLDFLGLPEPVSSSQYFPSDIFTLSDDEVFVDCGAFDGDTIRDFLRINGSSFKRIIAFEPDPHNLMNLKSFLTTLDKNISGKVTILPYAVGKVTGSVNFEAGASLQSSVNESGGLVVDCVRLDEVVDVVPTYIKLDVEGAEEDAIIGMSNTITTFSPILAISLYHKFDHLWKLPLLVNELSHNYTFYLRPHRKATWDLVCYAVPVKGNGFNDRIHD